MLEYIYICRHGFRSNLRTEEVGRTGMIRDHPLAATGLEQAARLGTFLSTATPRPEFIVSSPFYRCVQTALPTAQALTLPVSSIPGSESTSSPFLQPFEVPDGHPSIPIHLDHGVAEWYAPAKQGTGLHPRPDPKALEPLFPPGTLSKDYTSTVYPDRNGEDVFGIHDRIATFVDAWTARMDEAGIKTAVIFGHAATVIALGRELTGELDRTVCAGCACTSLYKRVSSGGTGAWEVVYNGRADYLPGGVERDWSFDAVELKDRQVVEDEGDFEEHSLDDELPVGLGAGMERYLETSRKVSSRL